jgi:hypothetical protein
MKKGLLFALFLAFLSPGLYPQITITNDDMPVVGDTVRLSNAVTVGGIDFSLTGENYDWDFASLGVLYQSVDTFVSVLSTPLAYQLIFFYPIYSTLAQPLPDFDIIPGVTVSQVYYYYKGSNSSFGLAGYAFTVNAIPVPLRYDNPDRYYKFPLDYGNVDSSSSSFTLNLPDVAYVTTSRERLNTVDGWGTLTTPYGSFEILRLKSDVSEYDSIYIDSLNLGVPVSRNYTEYKWLANGHGVPVLQVTQEGELITVQYIDSVRTVTSVAHLENHRNRMALFPNPCRDVLYVQWYMDRPGPVHFQVVTATGQRIWNRTFSSLSGGDHSITIPMNELKAPDGNLFLVMRKGEEMEVRGFVKLMMPSY